MGTSRRAFLATAPGLAVAAPAVKAQAQRARPLSVACAFPPDWPVLGSCHKVLAARLKGLGQPASTLDAAADAGSGAAAWPQRAVASLRALQAGSIDALVTTPGLAGPAGEGVAAPFLAGPPFGLGAAELDGWYRGGDGAALADSAYRQMGLRALYLATASPGTGFWFRGAPPQESLADWPVVVPEPAAGVLRAAGAQARAPGPEEELATTLAGMTRGAVAGVSPAVDRAAGLASVADGLLPGAWHRPGLVVLVLLREERWQALDESAAARLAQAVAAQGDDVPGRLAAADGAAHQEMDLDSVGAAAAAERLAQADGREKKLVVDWPSAILNDLGARAGRDLDARASADEMAQRIFDSLLAIRPGALGFTRYHQQSLYRSRLLPFPFAR